MTSLEPLFSKDVGCMQYSAIRKMAKMSERPGTISFAAGAPNADTFPSDDIRRVAMEILESDAKAALQYGLTLGYSGLVDAVVDFCRTLKRIETTSDEICITSGSQQALDLVGRLFLDPGDVVFVELPSYIGAISAFRNLQAELCGVRQESDGIDVEDLVNRIESCRQSGKRAKFIYVIPNFQNPSGLTVSLEKRKALLQIAGRYDLLIVEDDPYGEVYFDEQIRPDLQSIRSFDSEGRVVYLSSFSKILAAGLRVGWIVASRQIIEKLDMAKQATDLCGSMLDQRIVAESWRRGIVLRHLPRIREFYRDKCKIMLDSLSVSMPDSIHWTKPLGGLFLWMQLPGFMDSERILDEAIADANVTYVVGYPFYVNGAGRNALRLAFSKEGESNIRIGVETLAQVFRRHSK